MNSALQIIKSSILKSYKIDPEVVEKLIIIAVNKDPKLRELINNEDVWHITRTKKFKDFTKKLKRTVYFTARTYYANPETERDSIDTHKSTSERNADLGKFNDFIKSILKPNSRVLDLGGGLMLLALSDQVLLNISQYTWVDKDARAYTTLQAHLSKIKTAHPNIKFELLNQNINLALEKINTQEYDLIFMVKLIPVVNRQDREVINKLALTKSKLLFITGNKEALTKKQDIQHREKKTLKAFIKLTGRKIVRTYDSSNEFGYLLSFE